MTPTRVHICAYDSLDSVGGPLVWAQRMPVAFRAMGFEVQINLLSWQQPDHGVLFRALSEEGIPVQARKLTDAESNVRWLLTTARNNPPDVWIANHVIPAYYAGRYLREAGVPTVGVLRSDDPFYYGIAERFVYPAGPWQVSALVCVSQYLLETASRKAQGQLLMRRISSGAPVPGQWSEPPGRVLRIAYVGRLSEEQKQASLLARALVSVVQDVEGVEVALLGDGPARMDVERIIAASGAANIRCAGPVPSNEIQTKLLQAHVIVLLSDYEGTPMALMEAMACGCVPVCLRTRSGIPELIEHEATGLIVENRDEDFIAAIRRLKNDTALWKKLSQHARLRIQERHSLERCAADWAELIGLARTQAPQRSEVRISRRIKLPNAHPDFAHQDWRRPSTLQQVWNFGKRRYIRLRIAAGRVRRQLLGQTVT